jgi:hypothetical protein
MNTVSILKKTQPNTLTELPRERRNLAKSAYTTRRVDLERAACLLGGDARPQAGDLVLARVDKLGQHVRIELGSGRRAHLHPGDEIIVCYGARYAPDQFEAYVPDDLGPCDLVAAGGIAARAVTRHAGLKRATRIVPVGLLADRHGQVLNLRDHALPPRCHEGARPAVVAVVGTAMNAGKTTTAANLVRGYKGRGHRVGAAKVTGTGAGGDRWAVLDAGADRVLDFTDCGLASTYGVDLATLERMFEQLIAELAADGADVVVLEIADGLLQDETAALLQSPVFATGVDALVFAAGDALGALAGVRRLAELALPVVAVSGLLTAAPLALREAAAALGLPVVGCADLGRGRWLPEIVPGATAGKRRAQPEPRRVPEIVSGSLLAAAGVA